MPDNFGGVMLDKEQIRKQIKEHRPEISRFGVTRLALFGSYARGDQTATSDIDFIVELQDKTFDAYMGLKQYLEELFSCSVDLVFLHTVKSRLKSRILGELVDVS